VIETIFLIIGFLLIILIHELGHWFAAKYYERKLHLKLNPRITYWNLGGLQVKVDSIQFLTLKQDTVIKLAGVFAPFILLIFSPNVYLILFFLLIGSMDLLGVFIYLFFDKEKDIPVRERKDFDLSFFKERWWQ